MSEDARGDETNMEVEMGGEIFLASGASAKFFELPASRIPLVLTIFRSVASFVVTRPGHYRAQLPGRVSV